MGWSGMSKRKNRTATAQRTELGSLAFPTVGVLGAATSCFCLDLTVMIACTLMTCHVYPIKPFKLVFLGSLPLQRGKKRSSIALCGAVRDGPETRQGGGQAAREDLGCGVTEYH